MQSRTKIERQNEVQPFNAYKISLLFLHIWLEDPIFTTLKL